MKKKELNELRSKSIKDLNKIVFAKKAEAQKAKISTLGGKEKNLKMSRNLRREVAKILTLIREKEILESLEKKTEAVKEEKEKEAKEK